MSSNPYLPPTADVDIQPAAPSAPPEVLKKIKEAWIAGVISGCLTLAITLLAMAGTSALGFDVWNLIDVALIFGLAYGIYRKSRTCALIMFVYFVASKILIVVQTGKFSGSIMAFIFLYYYAQGVSGAFSYHKLLKAQGNAA